MAAACVSAALPRVYVRCARALCCVYPGMHWGRPPAELRAGVRWAKLAWRFGCVGAVRRKRGRRCSIAGGGWAAAGRWGEGEGEKEG
jgi:hypothetical protein